MAKPKDGFEARAVRTQQMAEAYATEPASGPLELFVGRREQVEAANGGSVAVYAIDFPSGDHSKLVSAVSCVVS